MRAPIDVHMPMPIDHHDTLEKGARLGFAVRGLVYFIVGGFAFLAAAGRGGGTTDAHGALRLLLVQPFGRFLLVLVCLGLVGYAVWRLAMGARDPERRANESGGVALARRVGYIASGIANLVLATFAGSLALPGMIPAPGSGDGPQDWTATLMAQPFGRGLVALVGIVVIGVAGGFAVRAIRASFERSFDPAARTTMIRNLCRTGILARAAVFAVIGVFFLLAAWHADPSEAKGLGTALDAVRQQPFGTALLGLVGLGLVAYGCYSWIACRWRRIQTG
jgi:Domain of Unknown Function (DUF1206)